MKTFMGWGLSLLCLTGCGLTAKALPKSDWTELRGGWESECQPASQADAPLVGFESMRWSIQFQGITQMEKAEFAQMLYSDANCKTAYASVSLSGAASLKQTAASDWQVSTVAADFLMAAHQGAAAEQLNGSGSYYPQNYNGRRVNHRTLPSDVSGIFQIGVSQNQIWLSISPPNIQFGGGGPMQVPLKRLW